MSIVVKKIVVDKIVIKKKMVFFGTHCLPLVIASSCLNLVSALIPKNSPINENEKKMLFKLYAIYRWKKMGIIFFR